ncbi:hypothetical protein TNCV_4957231 [Trichonephila clavipes]|nr:hypothetical protein TNCV_4957231 [Trichonephila clavipes]
MHIHTKDKEELQLFLHFHVEAETKAYGDDYIVKIVRVQYFVRGRFVGQRSRVSSKSISPLPVDGVRFLGGQKRVALQLQDARVGVGSNKDADRC